MIIATFSSALVPLDPDFEHPSWQQAPPLSLDRNWRGDPAPPELRTTARVLWTAEALYFGFLCDYTELDMDTEFDPAVERHGLWDRDVCEAFIRSPLEPGPQIYKEFEVAPTGQWCDLLVDRGCRWHDWEWRSGMRTGRRIDERARVWSVVMAVPFPAFGLTPRPGDEWAGNLFRVSRLNGERHYLALSPTFTAVPNYHVPERFVALRFAG